MSANTLRNAAVIEELLSIIRSGKPNEEIATMLADYHENDIADTLSFLTRQERAKLYSILGSEQSAEILSYSDDAAEYLSELRPQSAADILEDMDAADAVDILEDVEPEKRRSLFNLIDDEAKQDIKLISSYSEDEVGSYMSTNFIQIEKDLSIKQAMKSLISQAEDNDNVSTIFVCEKDGTFYGAIDLKDLIIAREHTPLETLITNSFPTLHDHEDLSDCIEELKDYAEDSIPVLDDKNKLIGVITSQDIIEAVDEELGDDYAKLAGLTSEEDLNEPLSKSIKKRLPWLVILLGLGLIVSSVVGMFESVVSQLTLIVCFQSLILDMAGNVGTQSLAVTIRVLADEKLEFKERIKLIFKEVRISLTNGFLLGILSFAAIGLYIMLTKSTGVGYAFAVSGCVGAALLLAMLFSGFVGTAIPLIFDKLHIDPAVASGPLITTINDLVAVITYYGLAYIFLINILGMTY